MREDAPARRGNGSAAARARGVTEALLRLATFAPLILVPGLLYPTVTGGVVYFRAVVTLALLSALFLFWWDPDRIRRRRWWDRIRRDPFFLAFSFFVVVSAVAAAAGPTPWRGFFGGMERLWGVVTWGYFLLFYCLLRLFLDEEGWRSLFRATLVASVVVACVVVAREHALLPGLTATDGRGRAAGLAGSPAYTGAYLLLHIGLAVHLWPRSRSRWGRLVLSGVVLLGGYACYLTATRAILLGGAVAVAVAGAIRLAARVEGAGRRAILVAVLAGLLAGGGVLLTRMGPEAAGKDGDPSRRSGAWSRLTTLPVGDESLRLRYLAWGMAWEAFVDRPLLGVGPENFELVHSRRFRPLEYELARAPRKFDRAHNAVLEVASTTGVLGLLGYLGMWGALVWTLVRARREGNVSAADATLFGALVAAYGVYLLFWFEDHDSLIPFLAVAAWLGTRRQGGPALRPPGEDAPAGGRPAVVDAPARQGVRPVTGLALAAVAAVALWGFHQQGWELLDASRKAAEAGSIDAPAATREAYRRALAVGASQRQGIVTDMGAHLVGLSGWMRHRARDEEGFRREAKRTLDFTVGELDGERARDPDNHFLHMQGARLHQAAHWVTGEGRYRRGAVAAVEAAIAASPRRVRPYHVLARLHLQEGRPDPALEALARAEAVYDGFGETDYHRARALWEGGEREAAVAALHEAYARGFAPGSPRFPLEIGNWLAEEGRYLDAARLLEAHLAAAARGWEAAVRRAEGPAAGISPETEAGDGTQGTDAAASRGGGRASNPDTAEAGEPAWRLSPWVVPLASRVPLLHWRAGDAERAHRTAVVLARHLPENARTEENRRRVESFLRDLGEGRTEAWEGRAGVLDGRAAHGRAGPVEGRDGRPQGDRGDDDSGG